MSFKSNLKDISFHISINSLGFYLFPQYLLNFLSNLYIPPCEEWIQAFLLLSPSSSLKTLPQVLIITLQVEENYPFLQAAFFRKFVSPNIRKEWRKLWFTLSEFNEKIRRWLRTWDYLHFYFLFLQFCKQYLSYGMLLVSLSVFCNHDTLILKSNLKEIASLMRSGFLQVD